MPLMPLMLRKTVLLDLTAAIAMHVGVSGVGSVGSAVDVQGVCSVVQLLLGELVLGFGHEDSLVIG